jgi:hypothetical protein
VGSIVIIASTSCFSRVVVDETTPNSGIITVIINAPAFLSSVVADRAIDEADVGIWRDEDGTSILLG